MAAKNKKDNISNIKKDAKPNEGRSKGIHIATIITLIIVVISFILVPALPSGNNGSTISLGKYGDRKIEYYAGSYFADKVAELGGDSQYSGIDNFAFQLRMIWQSAFNQTATHYGILHLAEKSGVKISEEAVDKAVVKRGPFQSNGEFDPEAYKNASAKQKRDIKVEMKDILLREVVAYDFTPGNTSLGETVYFGLRLSSDMTDFFYNMGQKERSFSFAALTPDDYPESEVKAFADEKSQLFQKMHLNQITLSSKANAEAVLAKLSSGEDTFSNLVEAHSVDNDMLIQQGGDLGWMYFYALEQALEDPEKAQAVMSLGVNEVSEIYEVPAGFRIYQALSPVEKKPLKNDAFLSDVRFYITNNEKGMMENYLINQAEKVVAEAKNVGTLETAAEALNIDHERTDFFPINYGNVQFIKSVNRAVDHPAFSGAGYNMDFFKTAFSLTKDEISEPILIDDNIIVLQMLDEREKEDMGFDRDIYDFQIAQLFSRYNESELKRVILDDPAFHDNFEAGFSRVLNSLR